MFSLIGHLFWGSFAGWSFIASILSPRTYILCSQSKGIYTVDEGNPQVECMSVRGEHVAHTGSREYVLSKSHWSRNIFPRWYPLPVVELEPTDVIVPGLADAHAHVLEYGWMMQLALAGTESVQDVIDRIKRYLLAHPDILNDKKRWIEGMGWDQTKWNPKQFPTAADLDADPLLYGRLIALSRVDGHAKWVSPQVIELMGDLPETVEGGLILRDDQGNPTGIFIDTAMSLIPIPTWNDAQLEAFFSTAMRDAVAHGLTSIHDAHASPEQIAFYKRKSEEGNLPIRLYLMGHAPPSPTDHNESDWYWGNKIERLIDHGRRAHLNVRSIKMFTDGALGSWGAALINPYSDRPDTRGIMRTPRDELARLIERFWEDGWQVNIHCIGDRANRVVLDLYEDMVKRRGADVRSWRPRIEHAQIIELGDLERVGSIGVITSVQPTHATSDMWYAETRLGPDRIKGAYAYQTLLENSPINTLPLGSDFPVEGVNPLLGFYAAVTRLAVDGTSPHGEGGWFPAQRLTRVQALKGMTLDAAYASFAEHELGSLVPGKRADYVVLDRDIMRVPVEDILKTKVRATVVDGDVVFGDLGLGELSSTR